MDESESLADLLVLILRAPTVRNVFLLMIIYYTFHYTDFGILMTLTKLTKTEQMNKPHFNVYIQSTQVLITVLDSNWSQCTPTLFLCNIRQKERKNTETWPKVLFFLTVN